MKNPNPRYTVIQGCDWHGDLYWSIYDHKLRIDVGQERYYDKAQAVGKCEERNRNNFDYRP